MVLYSFKKYTFMITVQTGVVMFITVNYFVCDHV